MDFDDAMKITIGFQLTIWTMEEYELALRTINETMKLLDERKLNNTMQIKINRE